MGSEQWLAEYDPLRPNSYAEIKARLSTAERTPEATEHLSEQPDPPARDEEYSGSLTIHDAGNEIVLKPAIYAMMEKMGYERGRGLGATSQGRVAPLGAEGNEGREGLGKAVLKSFSPKAQKSLPPSAQKRRLAKMHVPVAQTLMIRNVPCSCVAEVKQMFSAFGELTSVVSHEGGSTDKSSSARSEPYTLVTFRDVSSATRAALALQGAMLGGSSVRVSVHAETFAGVDEEI